MSEPRRDSLALLTDLYQITMACGYWKTGKAAREEAVFHLGFRRAPFEGGFAVACGLAPVLRFLESFRFDSDDLDYLATLVGNDDRPLFPREFLDHLGALRLSVDVDAAPEGTVVFPHEPILRVRGPILEAQILETALLNLINFPTLVATKAARIALAAGGAPILEFGLRRAQGVDGALEASRASFVGGAFATSNLLAGRLHGIPVRGTHAHSWVMSFDSELDSFLAWAEVMPGNCVFLVDTFDTLDGVCAAVEAGKRLREGGHEMIGVRLDSGDLAWLSKEARRILDEGGFPEATIVASNDLDERLIESLVHQGAKIDVFGVGTRLVTGWDQPALGGVYKLSAVRTDGGPWEDRIKLSEQSIKISTPGIQQVRRFSRNGRFVADMVFDERFDPGSPAEIVDPMDPTRRMTIEETLPHEDLLVPVLRGGKRVFSPPPLAESRARTFDQLGRLHDGILRQLNPHRYPVGLERTLFDRKDELVRAARARRVEGGTAGA
jgi:nicotinate phosphoribosyltransferase